MISRRLYKFIIQVLKRDSNSMNRTYHKLVVRYPPLEEDKMSFDFFYPLDDPVKKSKHFALLRSKDEDISSFIYRIKAKVNVEFEKKITKNNKKNLASVDLTGYVLDNVCIMNNGSIIDMNCNDSISEIFVENSILKLNNTEYITIINSPLMISLKLPKTIFSNCPIIPIVKLEHGKLSDLQFEWFISDNAKNWKLTYEGTIFRPSDHCLSNFLKVVAKCNKTEQSISAISQSVILKSPTQQAISNRLKSTSNFIETADIIRLVSYNVLALSYSSTTLAKTVLFRHCPEEYLNMEYRKHLLMREICDYHSDLILLQEVDSSEYAKWWQPILENSGYDGLMIVKSGSVLEGQAIFWRRSKLKLLSNISVPSLSDLILNDSITSLAPIRDWIRSTGDELQQWMEMRQCMAACVLETSDGEQLIVANTHLYFQSVFSTVRLFQMAAVINHLDTIKTKYPRGRTILCGDFNDTRNSSVIDFIEKGLVTINVDSKTVDVRHEQSLASAYNVPFTNYVVDFSGEIDFIYYDKKRLVCERTIPMPTLDDVTENIALPNKDFPSDHLALIAELKIVRE